MIQGPRDKNAKRKMRPCQLHVTLECYWQDFHLQLDYSVDFKSSNQDVIEVQTISFNLRVLIKVLHRLFWGFFL